MDGWGEEELCSVSLCMDRFSSLARCLVRGWILGQRRVGNRSAWKVLEFVERYLLD